MHNSNKNAPKVTKSAQKSKEKLIKSTKSAIIKTYKNIGNFIEKELKGKNKNNFSEYDLILLQKKINNALRGNSKKIESLIELATFKMIDKTLEHNLNFYKAIDKKLNSNLYGYFSNKYSEVKDRVEVLILRGEYYKDKKHLSSRIWKDLNKNKRSIDFIISQGIKNKEHPLTIAKRLEKYVNPSKAKNINWSKEYPGSKSSIEYNALRLAKTTINHAHHQSVIEMAKKNPLVTHIRWISAHSHRSCPMCSSRDGVLYPVDKVPHDHPNGQCDIEEVIPEDYSVKDLVDKIEEE